MSEANLVDPRRAPAEAFTWAGMAITVPVMLMVMAVLDYSWWLWAYLLGVNAATFCLYGYDKFAATRQFIRVPETTLHYFVLFGGTPAAYAAQQYFRHKTRKRPFQLLFWLIVAAQVLVVGLLTLLF